MGDDVMPYVACGLTRQSIRHNTLRVLIERVR